MLSREMNILCCAVVYYVDEYDVLIKMMLQVWPAQLVRNVYCLSSSGASFLWCEVLLLFSLYFLYVPSQSTDLRGQELKFKTGDQTDGASLVWFVDWFI